MIRIKQKFSSDELDFHGELSFSQYMCLITGKNGSGKSRILTGIKSGRLECMDGPHLQPQESVEMINTLDSFTIDFPGKDSILKKILVQLYQECFEYMVKKHPSHSSEISLYLDDDQRIMGTPYLYNANKIILNAERLYEKEAEKISKDELKLSILIHEDAFRSQIPRDHEYYRKRNEILISLPLVCENRHIAHEQNEINKTLMENGERTIFYNNEELKKRLGASLVDEFNIILGKLFDNKFKLGEPEWPRLNDFTIPLLCRGNKIKCQSLSSGEKTLLWLAHHVFNHQYIKDRTILQKKSIILLDEPDSKLHPKIVTQLYKNLELLHDTLGVRFLITTHSPTTVALFPFDDIYILSEGNNNVVNSERASKDKAISSLLDGVPQISVNPENRRQVYVENANDHEIYQDIYDYLKDQYDDINNGVSLTFVSSGEKTDEDVLRKFAKIYFPDNVENIDEYIRSVNGEGCCSKVETTIKSLARTGVTTSRGLIDWDSKNKESDNIIVIGCDKAYSIENLIYDPVCLFTYLHTRHSKDYPLTYFFDAPAEVKWNDAIDNVIYRQQIVDKIISEIVPHKKNNRDHEITYVNNANILGDRQYYIPDGSNGHWLEEKILETYKQLKGIRGNKKNRYMLEILNTNLITLTGRFIPVYFKEAMKKLQS
ncbi:ATP-binding protein [Klebsiella michiganensis]